MSPNGYGFERMVEIIPEGSSGNARIVHYEITEDMARFDALRALHKGYRPVSPGMLCQLFVGGALMMSDGENEHTTNLRAVRDARGDVLIAGLGIGMVLVPILRKTDVRSVTVVEKNAGVIELVEAPLRRYLDKDADKLTVIPADIFDWKPSKDATFDSIYLDIWTDICADNLKEITTLKRRFGRRVRKGGWVAAWTEDTLRWHKRREERRAW